VNYESRVGWPFRFVVFSKAIKRICAPLLPQIRSRVHTANVTFVVFAWDKYVRTGVFGGGVKRERIGGGARRRSSKLVRAEK